MKHILIHCAALILPLALLADEKVLNPKVAEANAADAKAQEGVWRPTTAVLGGMPLPPPALNAITLKITGDKYEVIVQGEGPDKGTTTLDTSTKPKRMSITGTDGPNKGKTFLAIYELVDADTLRICYDLSGTNYPAEFASAKDTSHYLVTYKREKK